MSFMVDHGKSKKAQYPQTIIIPVYKPSDSFLFLLEKLKEIFSCIIIVNDGSGKEYNSIFEEAKSHPGIVVLHHYVNLGKGRALKTAFNYCLSPDASATHGVITVDADGQHSIPDVIKIARALEKNPGKIILGCRSFHSSNIPFRSKFGNILSKIVYKWLCGISVSDTQTGLRGLPFSFLTTCCQTSG